MDVCTSVGGSSAKQTGLTALIAVIPNTYVVSPLPPSTPLSLPLLSSLSPSETDRERNSSSTVCVPGLTLRALSRPTYIRVETLHSYPPVRRPSDRRECVSVFVLARGWIVTTAEDTRLNTPTIVTIEREGEGERRGGRVSTPRVISVTILLFPPCPSSRCIRPFIVPLCPG